MSAKLATLIATAGFVGFVPVAPGTFGSLVGLALLFVVRAADSVVLEIAVLVAVFGIGIWAADRVEQQMGKDPGAVVIDEVLGMLVTLALIEVSLTGAAVAFVVFRAFDVVKPYPAGRLEHLHGGPGIMLDDAMAGVYANLTMRLLIAFFPGSLV